MHTRFVRAFIIGTIVTLASVLYSKQFNWPDYYHIEYGFPVAWLVRTLNTIIGPTNSFAFQPGQFALDLSFWSVLAFLILFAVGRVRRSRGGPQGK